VQAGDALELFTRLVEKSLVVRDIGAQSTGSARYYLYESVRAYAHEKLRDAGDELAHTGERLRDYVVVLVTEGDLGLRGREQAHWGARLADALDDVRAVLEQAAADPHGGETALRVAGNYWLSWMNRGMWKECADAIARALAHPGADTASPPFAKALLVAGNVAYRLGDLDRAREQYERARVVLERVGTPLQMGIVHMNLGNIALGHAEHDQAQQLYETALGHFRSAHETVWIAGCLNNLSVLALAREDIAGLEAMQSEALAIHEAAGVRENIALCLLQLGIAAFVGEDFERGATLARELDNRWIILAAEVNIAAMEVGLGRRAEARALLTETAQWLHDMLDPALVLTVLESTSRLYEDSAPDRSARLLAAAHAQRAANQTPPLPYERRALETLEVRLAVRLGDDTFAAARNAGGELSMAAALVEAEALLGNEP
jgi:tetratricopeptide (TPR) repeat protein